MTTSRDRPKPRQRGSRIVYFPVHDPSYPRNARVRAFLAAHGWEGTVIDRGHAAFESASRRDKVAAVVRLVRAARTSDVIVLSEMSISYAWLTWAAARWGRAVHVVDGFVGLYETRVLDWEKYAPRSLRAGLMRLMDHFAYWSADIFLTDTEVRASALRTRHGNGTHVLALPVGAPGWARHTPYASRPVGDDGIRVLFYGNYAPLHGVDTILRAVQQAAITTFVTVELVGEGPLRPQMEALARDLDIDRLCTFIDRVPEARLLDHIAAADVVLGIFGTSDKAAGVIANKVWQALACGRRVITRTSPALAELRPCAGPLLSEVPPADPSALAGAIVQGRVVTDDQAMHTTLEKLVQDRFERLLLELHVRTAA